MSDIQPAVDQDELVGAGILMLTCLRNASDVPAVPAPAKAVTDRLLPHMPPQTGTIPPNTTLAHWINAAAALEAQGHWSQAWDILTILQQRLARSGADSLAHRAFLSARLGRVVRMLGDLPEAERWYRDAITLTNQLPPAERWADARPQAILGLSVMEADRGNYPSALRYALKSDRMRDRIPPQHRVPLDQILALIFRKQKRYNEALSALSRIFDTVPESDPRYLEALIIFAELSAELQQPLAAANARVAALARAKTPRVAAAALGGLLVVAARLAREQIDEFSAIVAQSHWGRDTLSYVSTNSPRQGLLLATRRWLAQCQQLGFSPYDEVILIGSAIRLAIALERDERRNTESQQAWVYEALDRMGQLSTLHTFHERSFEVESLRAEWAGILKTDSLSMEASSTSPVTTVTTRKLRASINTTIERVVRERDRLPMHPQALLRRVTLEGYPL